MGSKNRIAKQVVDALPPADTLVDLFAGGCAVTHCAMLARKYSHYIINDINDTPQLFADAVGGRYRDENRWISREEFFALKDSDPYVRTCWSFGNSGETYMYARELEPWKHALHMARVHNNLTAFRAMDIPTDGTRADIIAHKAEYKRRYIRWWLAQQQYGEAEINELIAECKGKIEILQDRLRQYLRNALEQSGLTQAEVQRRLGTQMAGHYFGCSQWEFPTEEYYNKMRAFMPALDKSYTEVYGLAELWQRLQRLQRLQSLQSAPMERLTVMQRSYDEVELPDGAIVYCDIPYRGTAGYNGTGFDHESFYRWALTVKQPLYISEYAMPEPDFVCIKEISHRSILSAKANNAVTERIFRPRWQVEQEQRVTPRKPQIVQQQLPLQV